MNICVKQTLSIEEDTKTHCHVYIYCVIQNHIDV